MTGHITPTTATILCYCCHLVRGCMDCCKACKAPCNSIHECEHDNLEAVGYTNRDAWEWYDGCRVFSDEHIRQSVPGPLASKMRRLTKRPVQLNLFDL